MLDRKQLQAPRASFIRAGAAALIASASWSRPARATALERISNVGSATEDAASIYYAVKNGMFERVGLDVDLAVATTGSAASAAVVGGTFDTVRLNILTLLNAHVRGIPLIIIAPEELHRAPTLYGAIQVGIDSAIRTGSDLNGKTVGTRTISDLSTLATRCWVDNNGGDWKSLHFVELSETAMAAAIMQHRVDAAVLSGSSLDASLRSGTTRTLGDAYAAIAPVFLGAVYVARSDWASRHADAVRRFYGVIVEVAKYVNEHPIETASYVTDLTKIPLTDVRIMHRSVMGTSLNPDLIQPVIDAAAKYGAIPHPFPARELLSNSG